MNFKVQYVTGIQSLGSYFGLCSNRSEPNQKWETLYRDIFTFNDLYHRVVSLSNNPTFYCQLIFCDFITLVLYLSSLRSYLRYFILPKPINHNLKKTLIDYLIGYWVAIIVKTIHCLKTEIFHHILTTLLDIKNTSLKINVI
jgi:hypothetical protein